MLKETIQEISFESTFDGDKSYLDVITHLEGYITLRMDFNEGKGFDIEEAELDQLYNKLKQLFKQIKK